MKKTITIGTTNHLVSDITKGSGYDIETAVCELIDNAFDAGAKRVSIRIDTTERTLIIEDNGYGMDAKTCEENYFSLANSTSKSKDYACGSFGLGGKMGIMSIINLPSTIILESRTLAGKEVEFVWKPTIECDKIATISDNNHMSKNGTRITIRNSKITDKDAIILERVLSTKYFPTLANGASIEMTINGASHILKPFDPLYRNNPNVAKDIISDDIKCVIEGKNICFHVESIRLNEDGIISQMERTPWDERKNSLVSMAKTGIYAIYGGRYISLGGYDTFKAVTGIAIQQGVAGMRIEFSIPKELTEAFGIRWNKSAQFASFDTIEGVKPLVDYIKRVHSKYNCTKPEQKREEAFNDFLKKERMVGGYKCKIIIESKGTGYKDMWATLDGVSTILFTINSDSPYFGRCTAKDAKQVMWPMICSIISGVMRYNKTINDKMISHRIDKLNGCIDDIFAIYKSLKNAA